MPGGDGTGPMGTLINCTDPRTGLTRPLYRYGYGGYAPPYTPAAVPPSYIPPNPAMYPGYYGPGYGRGYGLGYGRGMRWGRGFRGRGRGW